MSGIYIAKPTRQDGAAAGQASHIVFIVRDDSRIADILFQTSDTTWQAYNLYGGNSLYCGAPFSNDGTAYGCAGRAVKVSYNRPFDTRDHDPQSFLFNAEYPMIRLLEANGYNVKYWSGVDTDRFGANAVMGLTSAKKPKIFFSAGHDEYWSGTQRTNVENARNAGVNLSFLSGNEVYWKTRWEPSDRPARSPATARWSSYKETLAGQKIDPNDDDGIVEPEDSTIQATDAWTGTWRDPRFSPPSDGGRPENALHRIDLDRQLAARRRSRCPASMAVLRLWRNTRVAQTDHRRRRPSALTRSATSGAKRSRMASSQPGWSGCRQRRCPTSRRSSTSARQVGRGPATHSLTLYRHNSGALVFGAGTVQWAWGLDSDHDRVCRRRTRPIRPCSRRPSTCLPTWARSPASLQAGADPTRPLVTSAQSSDIFAPTSTITSPAPNGSVESGDRTTISGTATDNGGGTVAGVEVSVDGGTTWQKAKGRRRGPSTGRPASLGDGDHPDPGD